MPPNCDVKVVAVTFGCTGNVIVKRSCRLTYSTYSCATRDPDMDRMRAADAAGVTGVKSSYSSLVKQATNAQWWILLVVALLIVAAWPSDQDRSLAAKFVNWAVDPGGTLPILPDPFAPGEGDDFEAVNIHDLQTRMY